LYLLAFFTNEFALARAILAPTFLMPLLTSRPKPFNNLPICFPPPPTCPL
jgi:hypothetical protein